MGLIGLLRAVRSWLFDAKPAHAMVGARVILGAAMFFCYLVRLPDVPALYGSEALVPAGTGRFLGALPPAVLDFVFSAEVLWGLAGLILVASLAFACGAATRISGAIVLALHVLFHLRNPYAYWGWAYIAEPFLLYAVLSGSGRFFSIDAWLRRRRAGEAPEPVASWAIPAWPMRLIQVHVCAMYATAGFERLDDPNWIDGKMLYDALTNALHSRVAFDWHWAKFPLSLGSYVTFVLEPLAPLMLWLPRLGTLWAVLLLGMHVALELLSNVGWWNYMMFAGLLPFLPAAWLVRGFEAFTRRPGSS